MDEGHGMICDEKPIDRETLANPEMMANGIMSDGRFCRFRCQACGMRLRDEWPAPDDTCSLCARDKE